MDLKLSEIAWRPAKNKSLSQYDVGDICLDSNGGVFLIGDALFESSFDTGCGCCSEDITKSDIVSYYPALNIIL